jgi:hypothetical protein
MRTAVVTALAIICVCSFSLADAKGSHSVRGHSKKDGTRVAPHHATNPNKSKRDNWSSKGNRNPYTGKEGTKDPNAPRKQ